MMSETIKCERCQHGSHSGPHGAPVNAGAAIAFWGDVERMKRLVLEVRHSSEISEGRIDNDPNGDINVYLWLEYQVEADLADDFWPGCIAVAEALAKRWIEERGL